VYSENPRGRLISVVEFSPGGSCIASGDEGGSVRLWDVASERQIAQWTFPGSIRALWFSPDGRELLMAEAAEGGDRPVIHRERL
jgi:WD40 repeat protein